MFAAPSASAGMCSHGFRSEFGLKDRWPGLARSQKAVDTRFESHVPTLVQNKSGLEPDEVVDRFGVA